MSERERTHQERQEIEDCKKRFYDYYEKYVVTKQREPKLVDFYALFTLVQIHQIAGGPDQEKAAKVMHELMGLVLSEDQSREMYVELRKDSKIDSLRPTETVKAAREII